MSFPRTESNPETIAPLHVDIHKRKKDFPLNSPKSRKQCHSPSKPKQPVSPLHTMNHEFKVFIPALGLRDFNAFLRAFSKLKTKRFTQTTSEEAEKLYVWLF